MDFRILFLKRRSWIMTYGLAVVAVIISLIFWLMLTPVLGLTSPLILFVPAIMLSVWHGGLIPGLFATALSCCFIGFFELVPVYFSTIAHPNQIIHLGIFALVGGQISVLSSSLLAAKKRAEVITPQAESNITDQKRAEEKLWRSLKELSDMKFALDQAAIVAITDANGTIQNVNDRFCEISQYSRAELIGQNHRIVNSGYHPKTFFQTLWKTIAAGEMWRDEIKNRAKDGSFYWVDMTIVPYLNEAGKSFQYLAIQFDITRSKQMEASLKQLNNSLEQKVEARTAELQLTLSFEATLRCITDKVRDSLDESQILQTVVQELGKGLGITTCNAALYDLDRGISTIHYEYNTTIFSNKGNVSQIAEYPEIYQTLFQGNCLQFCNLIINPIRGRVSMLACPIIDDQGILGDLWLVVDKEYAFREAELRLVQQVANQCAIAIRQARLYEEAQTQVKALEHLNWLKDDFLNTVSHELRTPVSNMRMSIRMLEIALNQCANSSNMQQKADQYLQILKTECEREISLINDILDLQRLESGTQDLVIETIDLKMWLLPFIKPFQERAMARQQTLSVDLPEQPLPPLASDITVLERILAELLNNACKYTPPLGEIAIRVEALPVTIQLVVKNSGVEIPSSELPRIFDKFYRIPNADPWKQGGTGLGLALTQKLVHQIKGTIHVISQTDETTFVVNIPHQLVPEGKA